SLRMSSEQKYKEGDGLRTSFEATNASELMVFTDRQQCYKTKLSDFADTKASALGAYLPTVLKMDEGENAIFVMDPKGYKGSVLYIYENGKAARVELSGFETKTNRKKLQNAYCDKSKLVAIIPLYEDKEIAVFSSDGRAVLFSSALLAPKAAKNTQGVAVMSLKKNRLVTEACELSETGIKNASRYRVRSLPAAGALLKEEDSGNEQITFE
ncbi:MAG: topoisomerase IV, partial [Oscillospiraceae bacterium]|nr:topoisomerase IV [Oscillospiraceae bacterium]